MKETAVGLGSCGGLSVRAVEMTNRMAAHEPRAILNRIAFGRLETFLAKQWLVVAEKPSPSPRPRAGATTCAHAAGR